MQDIKKLASISIRINIPKADRLQKLVPAHELYKLYIIEK